MMGTPIWKTGAQATISGVLVMMAACSDSKPAEQPLSQELKPCEEKLPATFEAESAQLQGVQAASDGEGFSGSGYVSGFGQVGQEVTFDVCAPESAYYTVDFTYAKGTDAKATRTLRVDGKQRPDSPVFSPLWSWDTWGNGGRRPIYLDAGRHAVTLAFNMGDAGEIRLDKLSLSSGPSSSDVSVRSLLMNNWNDLFVGWHAAKLAPNDDREYGPRLTALHSARDWPVNQIDEAQAFFRDDTGGTSYMDTKQFDTTASFTASDEDGYGEMHIEYGDYGGKAMPMRVRERMIVPPGENFVIVEYDIRNLTKDARQFSLLEWADLHNKRVGPSEDPARSGEPLQQPGDSGILTANWYAEYDAWIADMSQTNGTFLVMGSLGPIDHYVAGAPVTGGPDSGAMIVQAFGRDPSSIRDAGMLFSGPDVGIGMSKTLSIEGTQSATVAYYYGIADSLADAKLLADGMHSKNDGSAKGWSARSSNQWREWLSSGKGKSLDTPVRQWADAFRIALVTNRQSQQPEFGSFVAATNPAYDYKVWPRDSSVTAMSFDAAGYLDQAEKYWTWMADVQADGTDQNHPAGTWWTNYRYTARNEQIPFVEPELDCIGLFLVGAYRHYELLKDRDPDRARQFLEKVWPAAERSAGFISSSANAPNNFGFGAADFSIWEEDLEFAVFTQATYAAGLRAAELLAHERDDQPRAQAWAQARQTIVEAVLRDTSRDPCPGAWSDKNYFIRGVRPDCTLDQRVDGATGLLWVLGVLDAADPRTELHRRALVSNLKRGDFGFGLARYEGDEFYHASPYSPGGMFEANATMPVWPQMSMYMAMLEHWTGMDENAEKRLSWYVATTNLGYQPAGEAVDWMTERPLISTASEPVTAAWYQLALLNQLGMYDPRLP